MARKINQKRPTLLLNPLRRKVCLEMPPKLLPSFGGLKIVTVREKKSAFLISSLGLLKL